MNAPPDAVTKVKPYIAPERNVPEMTVSALVIGSILGIVYAASSVYLGLKVGLTVSASIPIAVLSITIFRLFRRSSEPRILVNNIVQTTGSAGESIAAGVAFTLPSLLLMGFEMDLVRVLLVALLGGILGVLMMIPLRFGLIVKEHGKLTYPEGTACAQVLIVGEQGGTNAKTVFLGSIIGFVHMAITKFLGLWKAEPDFVLKGAHFNKASIGGELTSPLLGVGYIIGYHTSAIMMAGGVLSFLVLVPLITHFGSAVQAPFAEGSLPDTIAKLSPYAIRSRYLLYIGAGAVATGGFISLARSLPTIWSAFRRGLGSLGGGAARRPARTEQDMSMKVVLFGSLALVIAIALARPLNINPVSAVLIVLFGFFFVTVSSRITGEIGSSSNPISGMTVATLLITCLLFVAVGWTGVGYKEMALMTAALVCVAASNGGTISQDLKTGFLVGATPHRQQKAILVGVITSALVIGWTLIFLNKSAETIAPKRAVYASYTVPAAELAADPTQEYEGRKYKVHHLTSAQGSVPRGKYYVDDAGKIQFVVDPGVCGTEGYRLQPAGDMSGAYARLEPPPAKKEDVKSFAVDDKTYRVAQDKSTGHLFLVDDAAKTVAYEATEVSKYDAPKAQLFALIIDGIIGGGLPWTLVLIGVFISLMLEMVGIAALPFAVGVYLPISTVTPIYVGGIIRSFVDKKTKMDAAQSEFSPGTLLASGLIAGGAIASLVQSIHAGFAEAQSKAWADTGFKLFGELATESDWFPLIPFLVMAAILLWVGMKAKPSDVPTAAH